MAALSGHGIVGMDLDGKALGREKIFGHDIERMASRRLEPNLPDLPRRIDIEPTVDTPLPPGLVDDPGGQSRHRKVIASLSRFGKRLRLR
jgi:hypothetical protein